MRARRLLRARLARVTGFLPRRAAAAFERGASLTDLRAAEARLGVPLPVELWELLRHRDGQAPGRGVAIADDARLLGARAPGGAGRGPCLRAVAGKTPTTSPSPRAPLVVFGP
jgi:hypothetical protein